jgi:iron(III) transport system substrate-binding protein
VVLYCGVDQDQSRPIADEYARVHGVRVRYEGETEAQRSIGLPQKLLQERRAPQADVFWANEIMSMVDLARRGILAPLPPGADAGYPEAWRDPDGRYVAFGGRARVFMVNTELLPDPKDWPRRVEDLLDPKYAERGLLTSMARPLTGTTYTHAVALLTRDEEGARRFFADVVAASEAGRLRLAPSNGSAMRQTRDAANRIAFCLTDTDDYWIAKSAGAPVDVVYPDQGEGELGAVLIPNTIALVAGGRNPAEGARLLAWIVSEENEMRLARGPSAQIPLRTDLAAAEVPAHVKRPGVDFRAAAIDWRAVGENRDRWLDMLNRLFLAASP